MTFKKIIKEICDEENINYSVISKDWIIVLEKNNVTNIITGYKFGINNHALGELLDDKYATFELLSKKNIPIIEHNIIYGPGNNNQYAIGSNSEEYVKGLFYKYNQNVVLKINDGTCGANVLHIKNIDELVEQYKNLSKKYFSMSLCPYYDIENEYRAIVVNGKTELLYKKTKPVVIGDGKSTLRELLINFNSEYFEENKILEDEVYSCILPENDVFEFDWRFNLAKGSKASFDISEVLKNDIECLAEEISRKIGLGFGSIDIIKTTDNKLFVMEINSGVMMENFIKQVPNGYEIAKNIYKKVIKSYKW